MLTNNYKNALKKIAWGYVFIYFSLNLGPVDALPVWVGYILLLQALDGVAEREPSAGLLKPFAFVLITVELVRWVLAWFSGSLVMPWISVITGIIGLYFHFQLLTNLSEIAENTDSCRPERLLRLRTLNVLLTTVLSLPFRYEIMEWIVTLGSIAVVAFIIQVLIVLNQMKTSGYLNRFR